MHPEVFRKKKKVCDLKYFSKGRKREAKGRRKDRRKERKKEREKERKKGKVLTVSSTRHSVQFSSVSQSCLTLCNATDRSMSGLPVHHQLPEFTQTHVH